jgi:hypothetical protein
LIVCEKSEKKKKKKNSVYLNRLLGLDCNHYSPLSLPTHTLTHQINHIVPIASSGVSRGAVHLLSGLAAGSATAALTAPIWMVKTRMQLDHGTSGYSSIPGACQPTYYHCLNVCIFFYFDCNITLHFPVRVRACVCRALSYVSTLTEVAGGAHL